ncbi:MAG: hypothetical protein NT154_16605 [Verrucomicrobia bacterium]|nr:hypothetical protein [Verrucomicrobiota bacterium]
MPDGPIALWRLAETNGTVAVDSAGFNDGTYSGGVTLGGSSFPNESAPAAKFNGSSGRALVPGLGGAIPTLNPQGSFSIEYWVEADAYGFYVPISSMNRPSRDSGYEFYLNGNFVGYEWHVGPGGYNAFIGSPDAPAVGTWYHIAAVFDLSTGGNGSLRMYINGVENDTAPGSGAGLGSPYVANTVLPLWIGARSDNTHYWPGSLADVALYNYVLTPAQIANHYSAINSPAAITQQPTGGTFPEGAATVITLAAAASGTPNTYQWVKNGVNLTAVNNADGTAHYPAANGPFSTILQGVNGPKLVINQAVPADSGTYHLVVSNPLGGATSTNVTVTVTADTTPPVVTAVQPLGTPNTLGGPTPFLVKVVFDKRIDPTTGGAKANYTFNPSVAVNSVTLLGSNPSDLVATALGADWRVALIATAGLTPGAKYSLTVTGVKDQAQTPIAIVPVAKSFYAPIMTSGALVWDYYY